MLFLGSCYSRITKNIFSISVPTQKTNMDMYEKQHDKFGHVKHLDILC